MFSATCWRQHYWLELCGISIFGGVIIAIKICHDTTSVSWYSIWYDISFHHYRHVKSSLAEQIIKHFNKLLQNRTTQKWSKFDTNTMLQNDLLVCTSKLRKELHYAMNKSVLKQFNGNSPHCREIHECLNEALFSHQLCVNTASYQLPSTGLPTFHFCC